MTLDLNVGNLIAISVAFIGALWALLKVFAIQHEKALEARFKTLNEGMQSIKSSQDNERENTLRIERELMQFKAELPRDYVRREDFIRAVGTIETKIDNMALRVERAVLSKGGEA
jgi:hypothetical protein